MKFRSTLLLAASMVAAGATQAATYDFGPHAAVELSALLGGGAGGAAPGSFSDFFTFELSGGPQVVSSSVVAVNNGTVLSITGGQYALLSFGANGVFDNGGGDDQVAPGSLHTFDGTTGSTTHALTLGPGKYYYAVVGSAGGSVGGYYTLSSTVTPVPEPHTQLLMLAGLSAFGFIAARRKSR